MRKPTSGNDTGATRPATNVITMGNRIFAVWETSPARYVMRMRRSFLVVTARIAGGWMMGTSAM